MDIKQIQQLFFNNHHYSEHDSNKLLDFINSQYIVGSISINEYKEGVHILENIGAKKPDHYYEAK